MIEEDQGWLPSAPVTMEFDNNRTEQSTAIALNMIDRSIGQSVLSSLSIHPART